MAININTPVDGAELAKPGEEFAPNTLSDLSATTLRIFYEAVFSGSSSGGKLTDFDGKGQPNASIGVIDVLGYDELRLNANLSFQGGAGIQCSYYFIYNTTGNFPDPGDPLGPTDTKTTTRTTTSTGNKDEVIDDLDAGTTYYTKFYYWNGFNSNILDYKVTASASGSTDTQNLPTPTISSGSTLPFNQAHLEWNYSDIPDTFEAQSRVNGSAWQNAPLVSGTDVNWGSSGAKEADWNVSPAYQVGDTVELRIRAIAPSGAYSTSAWSQPFQIQP